MNASKLQSELKKKAYLRGKSLRFAKFEPSFPDDHTFCVFCWARISGWDEDLREGYFEPESQSWICDVCTEEFKHPFEWNIDRTNDSAWKRLMQHNAIDSTIL